MTDIIDFQRATQDWRPEDKARALQEHRSRTSSERKVWYCQSPGRACDGKPHEGYPYKHARGKQWPPLGSSWDTWLIMSGRGWGKTLTGGNWIRAATEKVGRIALIGQTGPAVRAIMVEGETGLEAICKDAGIAYDWQPSKKEFTFGNGSVAYGFSAEEPDSLRGPQFGAAWLDEPAHMPLIQNVWDNLEAGLRLKGLPGGAKAICTSTPLPGKWLKNLIHADGTVLTQGHSDENIDNLDEAYRRRYIDKRRGTRLGRQEIQGEYLEDVPGSLWKGEMIRRSLILDRSLFDRIVVAIDPAGTANRKSDETGIVVVGKIGDFGYVLEDVSGRYSPDEWGTTAVKAYVRWDADAFVAEKNYGGDMVKSNLLNVMKRMKVKARIKVKTATRSKQLRAEPIVGLYEQERIFHNDSFPEGGDPRFEKLEEEQLTWVPGVGDSPNRIDALVWGLDELIDTDTAAEFASARNAAPSPSPVIQSKPGEVAEAAGFQVPNKRMFLPAGFRRR